MYVLPQKIESLMATLSLLYERNDKRLLRKVLVNARVGRIVEAVEHDDWNDELVGHSIVLVVPEPIFLDYFDRLTDIAAELCKGLNRVNTSIVDEFIHNVLIEKEEIDRPNWRADSGLLLQETHTVSNSAQQRIWKQEMFRLFISHKTEDKVKVSALKEQLAKYGVSCFVAHEDIEPTQRWAEEIENALFSMDACVALMTEKYHESYWTDHEVGCAYGRHVPVIAVRIGKDPYGLIARFQALSSSWDGLAEELMKLLLKYSSVKDAYIKAVASCENYEHGNILARVFPYIGSLTTEQLNHLIDAWVQNSQAENSFGFKGTRSWEYGLGICYYISKWNPERFPDEDSVKRFALIRRNQLSAQR